MEYIKERSTVAGGKRELLCLLLLLLLLAGSLSLFLCFFMFCNQLFYFLQREDSDFGLSIFPGQGCYFHCQYKTKVLMAKKSMTKINDAIS